MLRFHWLSRSPWALDSPWGIVCQTFRPSCPNPVLSCILFIISCVCVCDLKIYFIDYVLQLSHFFLPVILLRPVPHLPPVFPHLSSCQWVVHISTLASPFPILFLSFPRLFCTYHLCFLFPVPFSPSSPHPPGPLITLHVISISVILFLS